MPGANATIAAALEGSPFRSINAGLSELTASGSNNESLTFSEEGNEYTLQNWTSGEEITITAVPVVAVEDVTITLSGSSRGDVDDTGTGGVFTLIPVAGETLALTVTAQNGTEKTYTINVPAPVPETDPEPGETE
jgi:hypothetical protein